jgi:methionine aminopeptidase
MPKELQYAYDQAIKGQWIMRPTIQVGKKAGDVLAAMIKSMKDEGYIYTPFTDNGKKDREIIRKALSNTDKSGFSVDLHVQGNNNGELITVGASMAPFRRDRDHLILKENHIFAFEYMVHTNMSGREQPLSINISNVQAVTNLGVEWIQPPNKEVYLIH